MINTASDGSSYRQKPFYGVPSLTSFKKIRSVNPSIQTTNFGFLRGFVKQFYKAVGPLKGSNTHFIEIFFSVVNPSIRDVFWYKTF